MDKSIVIIPDPKDTNPLASLLVLKEKLRPLEAGIVPEPGTNHICPSFVVIKDSCVPHEIIEHIIDASGLLRPRRF